MFLEELKAIGAEVIGGTAQANENEEYVQYISFENKVYALTMKKRKYDLTEIICVTEDMSSDLGYQTLENRVRNNAALSKLRMARRKYVVGVLFYGSFLLGISIGYFTRCIFLRMNTSILVGSLCLFGLSIFIIKNRYRPVENYLLSQYEELY